MEETKDINDLLRDELVNCFGALEDIPVDSKEYAIATDNVCKLLDRAITIEKFNEDAANKVDELETTNKFKEAQMKEDSKDRKIRNGITIAGIVIPTVVTIWGTLKTFKFEETGTFCSKTFRDVTG